MGTVGVHREVPGGRLGAVGERVRDQWGTDQLHKEKGQSSSNGKENETRMEIDEAERKEETRSIQQVCQMKLRDKWRVGRSLGPSGALPPSLSAVSDRPAGDRWLQLKPHRWAPCDRAAVAQPVRVASLQARPAQPGPAPSREPSPSPASPLSQHPSSSPRLESA